MNRYFVLHENFLKKLSFLQTPPECILLLLKFLMRVNINDTKTFTNNGRYVKVHHNEHDERFYVLAETFHIANTQEGKEYILSLIKILEDLNMIRVRWPYDDWLVVSFNKGLFKDQGHSDDISFFAYSAKDFDEVPK